MPVGLALPKAVQLASNEIAATFVVPAPNGCNLHCAFCAIRARGEALPDQIALCVQDYVDFLRTIIAKQNVGIVSLQGYEPLLPESWHYSQTILQIAKELGVRTSLVTNGTYLSDYAPQLANLGVSCVTVSLDSAEAAIHDHTRGTAGAFAATVAGLRAAIDAGLCDQIMVASVMQKQRAHFLDGMPALLASLGLHNWVVTPVQRFNLDVAGSTIDSSDYVLEEARRLDRLSVENGVLFQLDDELEALIARENGEIVTVEDLRIRRVKRADQIIRLSPNGSVSRGHELRSRINSASTFWNPKEESVSLLIDRLFAKRLSPTLKLITA